MQDAAVRAAASVREGRDKCKLLDARWTSQLMSATGHKCMRTLTSMRAVRECETAADWAAASAGEGRDNSMLLDGREANQRLSAADIDAMKEAGVAGEDIMKAVVANSATFDAKTLFSQVTGRLRPLSLRGST